MHTHKRKIVVREEFQRAEIAQYSIFCSIRIITESTKRGFDLLILDVSNLLTEKLFHAIPVKPLQSVLQLEIIVVNRTLPIKM